MKIIDRYILKNLLLSFAFTLTIFTFVLFTGTLFKMIQFFLGKISLLFIGEFFVFSIPYLLSYAIPMSFLTANLLVFGQLSAENEITAMKACGVNILRLIVSPVVLGVILTFLCIFINDVVLPFCHYELRMLRKEIGEKSITALIEPGVFINNFDNYLIYIDEIEDKKLKNISIQQQVPNEFPRFIKAEHGIIEMNEEKKVLVLKLYDVLIEQQQKAKEKGTPDFIHARMGMVPVELTLDSEKVGSLDNRKVNKRLKDYTIRELISQKKEWKHLFDISGPFQKNEYRKKICEISTEINIRLSLAFSCLALLFIGISLGIRTHRSEKTVGIPISLAFFAINYGFTLFGKALNDKPDFYPEIIIWIPNICLGIIGILLLIRIAKR